MRKTLGLLFAVAWLSGGTPVWAAKPEMASMALATQPAGATYTLYDRTGKVIHRGPTPFVGMVPAGRYRLVITLPGYHPEQRSILLQGGQQKIFQIEMFPKPVGGQAPPARGTTPPARGTAPPTRETAPPTAPPGQTGAPSTTRTAPRQTPTSRPAPRRGVDLHPARPLPSVPPDQRQTPPPTRPGARPPVTGAPPPPAANEIPPNAGKKAGAKPDAKANALTKKDKKPKKPQRRIPWIPLAAAAGLGVAGGIFWGLSDGSLGASRDRNRTQIEAFNEYNQARSHRSTAVFLFAGGGVALGLAALFYFWPQASSSKGKKNRINGDIPIIGFTLDVH